MENNMETDINTIAATVTMMSIGRGATCWCEKKFLMPAFILGGNVMGTVLVMEHANELAQMIVSEKDKLFDERVEALVKLYRRAEFYLKQGFLESIVCEFHRKKVEMIMQAETKGEITEILKLSKPHFDGKKFVYTSPYALEE